MLHGTVAINEHQFAQWKATNQGPAPGNPGHILYQVDVAYVDARGYPMVAAFPLIHDSRLPHGALRLAAAVLAATPSHLRVTPLAG